MIRQFFARLVCRFRGCDFGDAVYISPSMLCCCHRCGEDIQGRSFEDLEPMTDADYEYIESLEALD